MIMKSIANIRPIYTIRFVAYDSDPRVCDRINTRTNVTFQILPSTNEQKMWHQKMWHQHSLSYVRMTIVYDKYTIRVDRPIICIAHITLKFVYNALCVITMERAHGGLKIVLGEKSYCLLTNSFKFN